MSNTFRPIAVPLHDTRFDQFTGLAATKKVTPSDVEMVRADLHFRAVADARYGETLSKPWLIQPLPGGNERIMKFFATQYETLDVPLMLRHMLSAVETGFSVQELILRRSEEDGLIYIDRVVGRPWHWFTFDKEWRLRFIKNPDLPYETVLLPEPPLLVHTHGSTEGDRRGQSTAELCYWYVYFRKGVMKYGLQWLEQFGSPTRFAFVPPGLPENKRNDLISALALASGQTVAVVDEGVKVDFMKVGTSSTSEMYEGMIRMYDRYISKLLVGGTLVTEGTDGAYGSRATAMAHLYKLRDIARQDAHGLMQTVNRVNEWLVRVNFGADAPVPKFFIQPEQHEVRASVANIYHEAIDRGVPITETDYYLRTGLTQPQPGDRLLKVKPPEKLPRKPKLGGNTDPIKGEAGGGS